jgi:phosphoribosylformimino-5-aminoimidazole carboxamide ribotide isomerase
VNAHDAPTERFFEVIPVIDLMSGLVVHARLGDRAHYQPIRSRLCESPQIQDVVAGLLGLFEFKRLYIADLDALCGRGLQRSSLDAVRRTAPGLSLWIDAGVRDRQDLRAVAEFGVPVLASETLTAAAADQLLAASASPVLSIDYRGERLLGEPALLEQPQRWPAHVIAMNLARVGSDLGPDLARIDLLRRLAPQSRLYIAGGVRDAEDLHRGRQAGAAGALVASALHDGRIQRADLLQALTLTSAPPRPSRPSPCPLPRAGEGTETFPSPACGRRGGDEDGERGCG